MSILMQLLQGGWNALLEYLSAHVLTCLVPAFFIAGAIAVFLSQGAVLKYFGPKAKKLLSYSIASVSGTILAVCSCTVLPLFGGIYKRGAGIGPAVAFLYSGPAINVLAIVYTARILGFWWQQMVFFVVLVGILIFAALKNWIVTGILLAVLGLILWRWFTKGEIGMWMKETLRFVRLIVPWLLVGVFVAGIIITFVPQDVVTSWMGGNSLLANFIASFAGALMYFATLTEVPIIKAFMDLGMGKGPSLALLLAGPALSLPNMLVIRSIMGTKKTLTYIALVVIFATITGYIFGFITQ